MSSLDVSVVVTCYNYGAFVGGALSSVLSQSVLPKEIIVVDDGSTDSTPEVLDKLKNHPLIRIVRQPNGGQTKAKNRGVAESSSEWIAFLDADDLWVPDKLEKQAILFSRPSTGVVYSRQLFIDPNGIPLDPQPNRLPVFRGNVLRELLKDNFVPFSSSVVRAGLLKKHGGFNETLSMSIDWDLWLMLSLETEFDFVNEDLLLYRVNHPGQMSKNLRGRRVCCDRIFKNFINENLEKIDPRWVHEAKVYTMNLRGYEYRGKDKKASLSCYWQSILIDPFQWKSWKGLILSLFI